MDTLSRHLLIELWDCDEKVLNDIDYVSECLALAATVVGVKIVKEVFHKYEPQGITGIVVIEESHISIHTWPERRYAAIDIYTCGEHDPEKFTPIVKEQFYAQRCTTLKIIRGEPHGFRVLEPKIIG